MYAITKIDTFNNAIF